MINYFLYFLSILSLPLVYGIVKSKLFFTKLIFVNILASIAILFIAVLASIKSNNYYFDIMLIYILLNFISSIAYYKYFKN